jgi:glutamate-1-semialdehyde aminotransferase
VTFRQLMEQHSSPARLAHHLDAQLPQPVIVATGNATQATHAHPATPQTPQTPTADSIPTLPAIPAAGAAATATPTNAASIAVMPAQGSTRAATDAVHQVIAQQMQLMAQQLALLQGLATAPVTYLPLTSAVPTSAAINTMSATNASPAPAAPTASSADSNISATTASVASEAAENTARYDVKKAFGAIARIYSDPSAPLSQRQQARLGAFMTRYIERTIRSKQYNQTHRAHLADPRVVNGFRPLLKEIVYQIVVDRSQGAHLFDIDGNDYVDVINGFGMSLFGWQPAFVVEAVKQQIDAGYEIGPLHPLAGEVAQLICALSGHARAALCNTGSEAVMGAMRIARTTTGRNLVVAFSGSYHGIFDEVIVRATKRQRPVPGAPGILPNTTENIIVLDYGTPESLEIIRSRADEIAAVLIEPVQSRRPDFQPREFLHALRGLCTEQGIVFILDEVITGFRCAPGGIQELFDLRADLCTYGKVIGGGFPIGVIAGTQACMDALDGGWWDYGDDSAPTVGVTYFAGTFVRHPLALAAAKASLLHLQQAGPALQQRLGALTTGMVADLNGICRRLGAPIEVRSFASVWKIFFTEDHPLQDLLFAMLRNRGIHIIEHFPCFLTTAHTAADIARITEAFGAVVTELQDSEFLPRRVAVTTLAFDAATPPVPGARLGKDPQGNPAWFVPDAANPGKFARVLA